MQVMIKGNVFIDLIKTQEAYTQCLWYSLQKLGPTTEKLYTSSDGQIANHISVPIHKYLNLTAMQMSNQILNYN